MKLKWLPALALLFCSISLFAQEKRTFEKPDYKNIEKVTKDKTSPFFYNKLFERYKADDTTLSLQEIKMLYYGFFFHADLFPLEANPYTDSLKELLGKQELNGNEKKNVIKYVKVDLKIHPFNLSDLNTLCAMYSKLSDNLDYSYCKFKFRSIAKAILSTGNGLSELTAMHIGSVSDEHTIVKALGYAFDGEQSVVNGKFDYLTLNDNPYGVKGIYFDVSQLLAGFTRMHKTVKHTPAKKKAK